MASLSPSLQRLVILLLAPILTVAGEITDNSFCTPTPVEKVTAAKEVYRGLPFAPGESSFYQVRYMGVLAGTARLEVLPPEPYSEGWLRVFRGTAHTGDWYRGIFIGHDILETRSRAPDFAGHSYQLVQDEGRLLGKRTRRRTELTFKQETCQVREQVIQGSKDEITDLTIAPGVMDTLTTAFKLRTLSYQPGERLRLPVYSSGKSWWLDIEVLNPTTLSVPAGTFNTIPLRLRSYLGDALQQKGDLLVWVANEHPQHPLIRIDAQVRVGSLHLELADFQAGIF